MYVGTPVIQGSPYVFSKCCAAYIALISIVSIRKKNIPRLLLLIRFITINIDPNILSVGLQSQEYMYIGSELESDSKESGEEKHRASLLPSLHAEKKRVLSS